MQPHCFFFNTHDEFAFFLSLPSNTAPHKEQTQTAIMVTDVTLDPSCHHIISFNFTQI